MALHLVLDTPNPVVEPPAQCPPLPAEPRNPTRYLLSRPRESRDRLPGNVLNALLSAVTGLLSHYCACDACDVAPLEDQFFGVCVAFEDDIFRGSANCIYNNVGNACNLVKPIFIYLEQDCGDTRYGHEHVLRGWLSDQFSQVSHSLSLIPHVLMNSKLQTRRLPACSSARLLTASGLCQQRLQKSPERSVLGR